MWLRLEGSNESIDRKHKDISILTKPEVNLAIIMKGGKTHKNTTK